jgi:DNA-binding transcriptional MerR regulator
VLRYWEQEFTQLKPVKRRGNRRYYQHHEVLLIRRIRELLYEQGFTINGARNRLDAHGAVSEEAGQGGGGRGEAGGGGAYGGVSAQGGAVVQGTMALVDVDRLRKELLHVIDLLGR